MWSFDFQLACYKTCIYITLSPSPRVSNFTDDTKCHAQCNGPCQEPTQFVQ